MEILCKYDKEKANRVYLETTYKKMACIFFKDYIRFCDENLVNEYFIKIKNYFEELIAKENTDLKDYKSILLKRKLVLRKFLSCSCNNLKKEGNVIYLSKEKPNQFSKYNFQNGKIIIYEENYIDLVSLDKLSAYIENKKYEIVNESKDILILNKK